MQVCLPQKRLCLTFNNGKIEMNKLMKAVAPLLIAIIWFGDFIPVTDSYEGSPGQCLPGYSEITAPMPNGLVICGMIAPGYAKR